MNYLKKSRTKKFNINEIQNKYKKEEKRKNNKKRRLPKDSNLGAVALEAGQVSTRLTRGVHFYCVINCI
jgi:hypothetical protein